MSQNVFTLPPHYLKHLRYALGYEQGLWYDYIWLFAVTVVRLLSRTLSQELSVMVY